jgi:type IX secretion system PorP/SprF family membrane protein
MNNYKFSVVIIFIFLNTFFIRGQQELSFNHYMFNSQLFNPAFVGSEENLSISSIHSIQLVGFEGNPTTNSILLDTPFKNSLGGGIEVISDQIGPVSNSFIAINTAYHLKINDNGQRLSLGLKLSGNSYNVNFSSLKFDDLSDPNASKTENYFIENIGFGLHFQTDKLYLGFSIPYFLEHRSINKQRHYYLSGGFKKGLNDKLVINPNFLIKKTSNAPTSIDISSIVFYDDLFWLGINYAASERAFFSSDNSGGNISIISGFKLNSSISIGYSIASQQGGWASSAQGPSHEIYIKFSPSKKTSQSDGENSTEVSESEK